MAFDVGSAGGKPGRAQPSMNVTPLVDVVLVLLIIFMVITPLLAKQLWLNLPNKVEKVEPPSSDDPLPIVITVTKSGEIRMNRESILDSAFAERLRRALAATRQRTVFFDAEEEAPFEVAVRTMDLARAAGAANIAVLTEPLPSR